MSASLAPAGAAGMPPGGMTPPPDPSAGADPDAGSGGDDVVCTICSDGQGGYIVYAGDEPDSGGDGGDGGGMSADDASAMGPAGGGAAGGSGGPPGGGAMGGGGMGGGDAQGQPADSVGSALKIAMDILNANASSAGAPGSSDDQFASGFAADKWPTPASGPSQKFPSKR